MGRWETTPKHLPNRGHQEAEVSSAGADVGKQVRSLVGTMCVSVIYKYIFIHMYIRYAHVMEGHQASAAWLLYICIYY